MNSLFNDNTQFMDCEMAYCVLTEAMYPIAEYIETYAIIDSLLDREKCCTNIPPIRVARELDGADWNKPVPNPISGFLEKAYLDAVYQLGDVSCTVSLARLYSDERYGFADQDKALFWFQKAAEAGYGLGEVWLGKCFYLGIGVETDYEKAFHLLVKHALTDDSAAAEAVYLVGDMYMHGHYVAQDNVQAYEMYQRAWCMTDREDNVICAEILLRLGDYKLYQMDEEESWLSALDCYQEAERMCHDQGVFPYSILPELIQRAVDGQNTCRRKLMDARSNQINEMRNCE